MKIRQILLAITLIQACRTSRPVVEVMASDAPSNPPSDDYLHVGRSVDTTFTISAISLPTPKRDYDYLDLSLNIQGTVTEVYARKNYKPGESISIDAHRDYDIIMSAYADDMELYSTKFCRQKQSFRAEEGKNTFAASLCAKAKDP